MSVNGVSHNNYALQFWQSQQKQADGTTANSSRYTSSGSASSSASSGSSSSGSLIEQLRQQIAMAMDTLGLKSGDRITFNTLLEARKKMESEFADQVKSDLRKLGVGEDAQFTLVSDGKGGIKVIMDEGAYKSTKTYQDSADMKSFLADLGLGADVKFSLEADGEGGVKVIAEGTAKSTKNIDTSEALKAMLEELELDEDAKFSLASDGKGGVTVTAADEEVKAAIEQYLADNPEANDALAQDLGLEEGAEFSLKYNGKDGVTIPVDVDVKEAIEQYFKDNPTEKIALLKDFGISGSRKGTLAYDGKGGVKVTTEHSGKTDKAIIEKYFADNPKMVDKFNEIQSLTNLEQARKSMALDPSTIRKRVQMESLVAWFAGEGQSVDQLMQYSGGQSTFAATGINYTA